MFSFKYFLPNLIFIIALLFSLNISESTAQTSKFSNWETNLSKKSIDLDELIPGGPPKDGIPSIDDPKFIEQGEADSWLGNQEPVIALEVNGVAKAYPLQILIYHEIANDKIAGKPVAVTFCPLCYSAIAFDRTVNGKVLSFGVSGFLRNSDLVMYDRSTESLWQQFTGKAIVGDYTGTQLEMIPSQIISYRQFKEAYPGGEVLSRDTGHRRNYGTNPYAGYDNINTTPMMAGDATGGKLPPMEKVIGVKLEKTTVTYPYSITKKQKVINDRVDDTPLVVFHIDGAKSALDARRISQSKESGSTGVFSRRVKDKVLTFEFNNGKIRDNETGSRWSITGTAVEGPMKGAQLERLTYGDYFAFAWLAFRPDSIIYKS